MQLQYLRNVGLKFGPKWEKPLRRKKKQEWANEKPKLDDARRLRGIYFIDPEDGEYKETIQNARTKLEVRMEAAMRCRRVTKMHSGLQELKRRVMKTTRFQKQSMRALWKFTNQESVRNHLHKKVMKITSKAKGTLRRVIQNLVHKFIPMLLAMTIPDAKAAVEKEWEEARNDSSLAVGQSKE